MAKGGGPATNMEAERKREGNGALLLAAMAATSQAKRKTELGGGGLTGKVVMAGTQPAVLVCGSKRVRMASKFSNQWRVEGLGRKKKGLWVVGA